MMKLHLPSFILSFRQKTNPFAISLVRSKEIAEELVEDVFVKLWANRHHITEIENITVYLYVAVKNKSLNILSAKSQGIDSCSF